jgi:CBS domain-containing protein
MPREEYAMTMRVGNTFTNEVVTAGTEQNVAWVASLMEQNNVGTVVITEEQRPVGIVTDRDIALAVAAHGLSPKDRVGDVMTTPVATIERHEGVFKATKRMKENALRRLVVVDELGRVVGLVSLDDLLLLLAGELQNLAQGVRAEVTQAALSAE